MRRRSGTVTRCTRQYQYCTARQWPADSLCRNRLQSPRPRPILVHTNRPQSQQRRRIGSYQVVVCCLQLQRCTRLPLNNWLRLHLQLRTLQSRSLCIGLHIQHCHRHHMESRCRHQRLYRLSRRFQPRQCKRLLLSWHRRLHQHCKLHP